MASKSKRRIKETLEILAAIAAILGVLVPVLLVLVPSLPGPWKQTLIQTRSSTEIQIETVRGKDGKQLNLGDRFSYLFGLGVPISVYGTTPLDDTATVWVVLRDQYGGYYLQDPPVDIRSGQWKATNIYPRGEITDILFVMVSQSGNSIFRNKVNREETGKFLELPLDSKIVGSIELSG